MSGVAGLLMGSENTGVVQRLHQVFRIAGGFEQQYQRVAGYAALVGLDLVRPVGLRTAISGLWEMGAFSRRARKGWIFAGIRGKRLLEQIIAHEARGRQPGGLLLSAHSM